MAAQSSKRTDIRGRTGLILGLVRATSCVRLQQQVHWSIVLTNSTAQAGQYSIRPFVYVMPWLILQPLQPCPGLNIRVWYISSERKFCWRPQVRCLACGSDSIDISSLVVGSVSPLKLHTPSKCLTLRIPMYYKNVCAPYPHDRGTTKQVLFYSRVPNDELVDM